MRFTFLISVFIIPGLVLGQSVRFGDIPEDAMIPTGVVIAVESDPVASQIASNAFDVATTHAARSDNPHGITAVEIGALPITGGSISGFLTAICYQTIVDPEYNICSSLFPTYLSLGYNPSLGPLGPRTLSIYPNMMRGVSDYGKVWKVYYPTNSYGSMFATLDDIPEIPDTSSFVTKIDSTNLIHDVSTSLIGHPYVLQGSTVVPATNAALTLSGVATDGGAVINLMPYQATRPSEAGSTGTLHIATAPDTYIVDVSGDIRVTECEYGSLPKDNLPVEWSSSRVDDTNWIISAWAPGEVSTYEPKSGQGYYATISNLVVYTYNRPGYWPNTLTNDTAALPFFVDSADVASASARRAVNSGSVRDYVTSRKREIAASAWRLTPSGKDAPSPNFVTLDLPLVQQGNIAFLQQGDYYVMSYEGGDWRTSTEGSSWQIGASGRADLTITSEGRMAFIRDFSVAGQVATIYCATNWMGGAASSNGVPSGADPYVEFSLSYDNPQFLACQECIRSYVVDVANGDYWLFQAPATEAKMFYRVVIPGGERRIIAGPTLRLNAGIEVGGVRYDLVTITNGLEVFEVVGRRVAP